MVIPVSVHQLFVRATTVISLCGNGLLLLLLLHRRSASLGNYRVLLIVFAITDIIISLFHIWYIPIFVLGKFGFIYYGYRSLFGKSAIAQNSNVLFSVTFYLPFFLIGIHFIYRYLLLARPSIVKDNFKGFMLFCAVYVIVYNTFFAFLSYCVCSLGISKRFYHILEEYELRPLRTHINAAVVEYVTVDHEVNFVAIFIILAAGSVGGHSILVSLVCIYKIFRALKHTVLDLTVKRVHIQLFRALLLQFSIPFIFSFLPFGAIVALPALGIPLGYTGDVCALLISLFPAIDPILIILSVSSFRLTLLQWIDGITGGAARRNEKNAKELSRIHYSMITRRSISTGRLIFT